MALNPLPPGQKVVSCHWVYTVKVGANGEVDRLEVRLVRDILKLMALLTVILFHP